MEINLLLSAKRLELAPALTLSETHGGVLLVKNVPACTYLTVTPRQWQLLLLLKEGRTVPELLEHVIEQRSCPPVGEFYELVLKAVRARILIEPGEPQPSIPAVNWVLALRPARFRLILWLLFIVGFVLTAALQPGLPARPVDVVAGAGAALAALGLGAALSASLLRGAGREVYLPRFWRISSVDACMLPPRDQQVVLLAPIALMAAMAGFLTWHRQEWSALPLISLLGLLRPVLSGRVNRMIRAVEVPRLNDARHDFIFPLNRMPRARLRLLRFSLAHAATWKELGYGVLWTLAVGYFFGVLTDVPPWTLAFWQERGPWVLLAVAGSLALLGALYLGSEIYLYAEDRAAAFGEALKQWHRRWFRRRQAMRQAARNPMAAVLRSPLFRMLTPPDQHAIAAALSPRTVGPWRMLHPFGQPISHVSLILSGRVGVYRQLASGRRGLVQVLDANDVIGLHDLADPKSSDDYCYRTLTPVALLRMDWTAAGEILLPRTPRPMLTNLVVKLPFLSRIKLSHNWHVQAVQRFAELSNIKDYQEGEVMLAEGAYSQNFFVLMEGEARIVRRGKRRGTLGPGDFFGEIGLLQNSNATASVIAGPGARAVYIRRRDFLRFVAHNYSVAFELERVSSNRLGRPIFPLSPGNFQPI